MKLTITEWISKIESKEIKIKKDPVFSMVSEENMIKKIIQSFKKWDSFDYTKEEIEKELHLIKVLNNTIIRGYFSNVQFTSNYDGMEYHLFFENNTIIPKKFDSESKGYNFIEPIYNREWEQPIEFELNIPSGKLVIANHFHPISKEPENEYATEVSVCNFLGRKNLTKHYESIGIGYGQMGTYLEIYYSDSEILIINSYLDDKEEEILLKKIDKEKFKRAGGLSLRVWRYEMTDLNTEVEKLILEQEKECIVIPVKSKIHCQHFYQTYQTDKEFPEIVAARIKIT